MHLNVNGRVIQNGGIHISGSVKIGLCSYILAGSDNARCSVVALRTAISIRKQHAMMVLRDSQQIVSGVYVDVSIVKCDIRRESESAVRCHDISRHSCLSRETSHHEAAETTIQV